MLTAALFIMAGKWKPECLPTDDRVNQMWCICAVDLAIKGNELLRIKLQHG